MLKTSKIMKDKWSYHLKKEYLYNFYKIIIIFKTVTADINVQSVLIFAHLFQESGNRSNPSSYDVCFQLESLKGRINLAVLTRERLVIAKLDGWPEVGWSFQFTYLEDLYLNNFLTFSKCNWNSWYYRSKLKWRIRAQGKKFLY